jgi:3-methyl-2-oxobutanoate hydroxymethyltransferase
MPPVRRLTSAAIRARKGKRFPVITAYDTPFARCVEEAGIDVILVGDSLGNVVLGMESTAPVELEDMCRHAAAVKRGTSRAHVIVDLPFGTYQVGDEDAVRSAIQLVKAGAMSVKLEGGRDLASRIGAIVKAGIPVVAHIGVLPQTASSNAGFRRKSDPRVLLADARAVEAAGAFAVVLEMVDADAARTVSEAIAIPTIGIGAGPHCDAQVLVLHDALGLYPEAPPFAKRFAELATLATAALRTYAGEVRDGTFPAAPPAGAAESDAPVYVVTTPS